VATSSSPNTHLRDLPAFSRAPWQMSYGERTVIEGMLAMLEPALAIEIGRAEGGSLRRIAAHAREVISFDIVEPPDDIASMANVTALAGDSHLLLPAELSRLASANRAVDFVLIDGDHSTDGARRDMQDVLDSDAVQRTVILAHDTLNQDVRRGLDEVDYGAIDKVAWIDLDFVPGYVARMPARRGECWGGIGLVVVDASGEFRGGGARRSDDLFHQPELVWSAAELLRNGSADAGPGAGAPLDTERLTAAEHELLTLREDLNRSGHVLESMQGSLSWQVTAPLRALKRRLSR
jgi:hypothetical protein